MSSVCRIDFPSSLRIAAAAGQLGSRWGLPRYVELSAIAGVFRFVAEWSASVSALPSASGFVLCCPTHNSDGAVAMQETYGSGIRTSDIQR